MKLTLNEEGAIRALMGIVKGFNAFFEQWQEDTGCVANFMWHYDGDKKILGLNTVSRMELDTVDKILYRREKDEAFAEKIKSAMGPSFLTKKQEASLQDHINKERERAGLKVKIEHTEFEDKEFRKTFGEPAGPEEETPHVLSKESKEILSKEYEEKLNAAAKDPRNKTCEGDQAAKI